MPKGQHDTLRLHTLSPSSLQRLALAGNNQAWDLLVNRQMVRAMAMDPAPRLRDHRIPLDDGLWLHFRKEDGRVTLLVEIGEHTSRASLNRWWCAIDTWRECLRTWQRSNWADGDDGWLFGSLDRDHQERQPYARIAQQLNDLIAWMLTEVLSEEHAIQAVVDAGEIQTNRDRFQWRVEKGKLQLGLGHARQILQAMGFAETDIDVWIQDTLQSLRTGQPAFPSGQGPISRDHVISRLKAWRARHPDLVHLKPQPSPTPTLP